MFAWVRYLLGVALLSGVLWMHFQMGLWLLATPFFRRFERWRWIVWVSLAFVCVWLAAGIAGGLARASHWWAMSTWLSWVRAISLAWALMSVGLFLALWLWRRIPDFDPGRRNVIRATGGVLLAAPFAATAFGVLVERNNLQVREIDISIPDLPRDLEGLRLVQLSDIHLSPFLSEKELERAVDIANELKGHLAIVTGDLITSRGDPVDVCLHQLARLKADAGIWGCLGNHEGYAGIEGYTAQHGARLGIRFLRSEARRLKFGNSELNLAGVDYQSFYKPYLADAAELVVPDGFNVLLSHNPDVFPVAVNQGYDLTLSGHTHGGQVNFEIFDQSLNVARFFTPFVYGVYQQGASSIYVTRGIGTVGIPARIGAPPEIALLRLSVGHTRTESKV